MVQLEDASYKQLFSSPSMVRNLVSGFIPDPWLRRLDFGTLESIPCHYVADDLRQRANDIVWRVRANDDWVYLYLMMEFQSTVDYGMPVRIMSYLGLLYQSLIRKKYVKPRLGIPPVLPIVLYNGETPWDAPTDIAEMLPEMLGLVGDYLPKLKYLLLDSGRISKEKLRAMRNPVAVLMQLEEAETPQEVGELVDKLADIVKGDAELQRIFLNVLPELIGRRSGNTLDIAVVNDFKEMNMKLSQSFKVWERQYIEQGKAEGRLEGRLEGEARILQRQLTIRFGSLPEYAVARIQCATEEQLDHWSTRLLRAETLAEVFEDNPA
ncbi:Rpn family recombination-promoting nuclease/putative transposase [Cupriavidus sp. ISTL7]|nr:Rpn family recombination-promoting nuclease/putative transposase [Cupriavidus sp. ISTL7]